MIVLKYVGKGSSLPHVPCKDLTEAELLKAAKKLLVSTRLFELVKPDKKIEIPPEPAGEVNDNARD